MRALLIEAHSEFELLPTVHDLQPSARDQGGASARLTNLYGRGRVATVEFMRCAAKAWTVRLQVPDTRGELNDRSRRFPANPSRHAGAMASGAAFFTTGGLFAEQLALTPSRTEGPFYPDKLPLDTDNDLIIVNDSITPAVGEITHLTGRVLDASGSPVRGATVEIWQCDANQVYLHTGDSSSKSNQQDKNFQGFGRFTALGELAVAIEHAIVGVEGRLAQVHQPGPGGAADRPGRRRSGAPALRRARWLSPARR